jgi:hypothetical protein
MVGDMRCESYESNAVSVALIVCARVPVRMRGHMESMPMIGCLAFPMRMFPREGCVSRG